MKWLKRKSSLVNPKDLDWGIVTADAFDTVENIYVHVFNSELTSEKTRTMNKFFIINKFNYYSKHLPENSKQKFILDTRGQNVNIKKLQKLKKEIEQVLGNYYFKMEFVV